MISTFKTWYGIRHQVVSILAVTAKVQQRKQDGDNMYASLWIYFQSWFSAQLRLQFICHCHVSVNGLIYSPTSLPMSKSLLRLSLLAVPESGAYGGGRFPEFSMSLTTTSVS